MYVPPVGSSDAFKNPSVQAQQSAFCEYNPDFLEEYMSDILEDPKGYLKESLEKDFKDPAFLCKNLTILLTSFKWPRDDAFLHYKKGDNFLQMLARQQIDIMHQATEFVVRNEKIHQFIDWAEMVFFEGGREFLLAEDSEGKLFYDLPGILFAEKHTYFTKIKELFERKGDRYFDAHSSGVSSSLASSSPSTLNGPKSTSPARVMNAVKRILSPVAALSVIRDLSAQRFSSSTSDVPFSARTIVLEEEAEDFEPSEENDETDIDEAATPVLVQSTDSDTTMEYGTGYTWDSLLHPLASGHTRSNSLEKTKASDAKQGLLDPLSANDTTFPYFRNRTEIEQTPTASGNLTDEVDVVAQREPTRLRDAVFPRRFAPKTLSKYKNDKNQFEAQKASDTLQRVIDAASKDQHFIGIDPHVARQNAQQQADRNYSEGVQSQMNAVGKPHVPFAIHRRTKECDPVPPYIENPNPRVNRGPSTYEKERTELVEAAVEKTLQETGVRQIPTTDSSDNKPKRTVPLDASGRRGFSIGSKFEKSYKFDAATRPITVGIQALESEGLERKEIKNYAREKNADLIEQVNNLNVALGGPQVQPLGLGKTVKKKTRTDSAAQASFRDEVRELWATAEIEKAIGLLESRGRENLSKEEKNSYDIFKTEFTRREEAQRRRERKKEKSRIV